MKNARLARFAWGVLGYNLLVIAWGAWVRVTGSGAGCGSHWPSCNGEVIPRSPTAQTLVEFSHRLTSGLDLILVLVLFLWVFRTRPRGEASRGAAAWSLVFLLIEALIGAGLVLFELVAQDTSSARAYVMSAHLVNTLLLLRALTQTAWLLSGGERRPSLGGAAGTAQWAGLLGLVVVVVTGGIAALGDTLFPATSLAHGLAQDVSATSPLLLRLRVLHPIAAVLTGALLVVGASLARTRAPGAPVRRASAALIALVSLQLVAGLVNVVLLAPGWLQLLHLLLADLVWIVAVVLGLETARAGATAAADPASSAKTAATAA